jgi:histidinol dehydrogenase
MSTTTGTTGPARLIGWWHEMDAASRAAFVGRGREKIFDPELQESIARLVREVRDDGDAALIRALEKYDGCTLTAAQLRVSDDEYDQAQRSLEPGLLVAIRDAISHVRAFNEQVCSQGDWSFESEPGLTVGEKYSPIASAGLFVPSGKGSFPSVLVQIGTPAVVAGVPEIAVIVPPVPGSRGEVDPAVLVVADELGLRGRVYRANGPSGVAALAFGTETVPQVLKVVGPGSPAVTSAQIEVQRYGTLSNMLLGPSESLILADDSADPRILAADLLNEAEHGPDSSSILVTDSEALLSATQVEMASQLEDLPQPRADYARQALGVNGGVVLVRDIVEGVEVANEYAPEHMQVVSRDEDAALAGLTGAAEILLGQWTPVAAANFIIGCPAALPTSGFGKVNSGITAETFRKRTAVAKANETALRRMSESILAFTDHEGFPAHGNTVRRRLGMPVTRDQ